ncbi:MAG TPA: iron ABC transporter permease [Ktedonobacteraceae bacterium]|nr:iron ABC transporter permease [Ktedonobacteraceae bacterium]
MKVATRKTFIQSWREHGRRLPASLVLSVLVVMLVIAIFLAVNFGAIAIPTSVIARILLNSTGLFHFARQWDPTIEVIVLQARMPVVIGAGLVGAALSIAGVLFQGMLRNPLADPYLIGTSSGAALGAAIAFVLPYDTLYGLYFPLTPILAFVGAILSVLFVYAIARVGGQTPVVTLLLAGVVINAVLVAIQTLILTISPHAQFTLDSLFSWLAGGVSVTTWLPVVIVGAFVLAGFILAWLLSGVLDAFGLGEEGAAHLGLHVERYKLIVIVVGSLLTAAAVSISGLIGFVGLVVPHTMRLLLGPRHRLLIPASALAGAIFLILADLLARTVIAPTTLPVGVFTALVGAPFFLFLLRNNKRAYRW